MYKLSNKSLCSVIRAIKQDITEESLAFQEDKKPGIQITVGYSPDICDWGFQTDDSSFIGTAYMHPIWGVAGIYQDSNCLDVARDIVGHIREQEKHHENEIPEPEHFDTSNNSRGLGDNQFCRYRGFSAHLQDRHPGDHPR